MFYIFYIKHDIKYLFTNLLKCRIKDLCLRMAPVIVILHICLITTPSIIYHIQFSVSIYSI